MGNFSFLLWTISFWFRHCKNFKNRSTFAKVTVKIKVAHFFDSQCIYCVQKRTRSYFLPARRYASAGNSDRNVSVRLSVCPSVTRRYCVKKKKASVIISSPSDSPILWCQLSSPNSKGFPRAGASNKGGVGKFSDFLSLNVNISKTVADTAKVTIND